MPASAPEVFAWHARPGAFERLTPPWETVEILERNGGIENGASLVLGMRAGPFTVRWVAEHRDYEAGRQFRDVQIRGPFARWEHTHRVEPDGPAASTLEDGIDYALPLGFAGDLFGRRFVERRLDRMFRYRHRVTADDVAQHQRYGGPKMKVLVTGSSGLIGSALLPFLTTGGHEVVRLVRAAPRSDAEILWDPAEGRIDARSLEGLDAAVHLAGENISSGRWTATRKARIRSSRVDGTRLLASTLAGLDRPPRAFVSASAIGYYGDRGDEELDEQSAPGAGFLAAVCKEWEEAVRPAADAGTRVVRLRFGVILSPSGGALQKMLPPFRLGLGGVIGNGRQYMSWLALDDAVGIVHHALIDGSLSGAVNAVAPHPLTNRDFTKILGRVLSRPTLFPVPAFAARLTFGEMADELLLASTRVVPRKLEESNYRFRFAELEPALRHLLGKA